jgi:hypothetical protein
VFSIADPVAFQDFGSVFRTDLDDPALRNAVMLTFAFAVTGGNIDPECLSYQNQAMSTIRERMNSPETALSLPTLGAILLLAGVEVYRCHLFCHAQTYHGDESEAELQA